MESKQLLEIIFKDFTGTYSRELGINLSKSDQHELFLWLIASKLSGTRVNDDVAKKAYKAMISRGLDNPKSIVEAEDAIISKALSASGFMKDDFTIVRELKEISRAIIEEYDGDLNLVHKQASDSQSLEQLLSGLPGMGPITTKVFLRELRGIWDKANPLPAHSTACSARRIGLTRILAKNDEDLLNVLELLQKFWSKFEVPDREFADFEVGLLRLGKNFCLKGKCLKCQLAVYCRYYADRQ